MWLYPFLSPIFNFFSLPQWFISFMTKCLCLQFSFQVKLNHPLCLPGVWELQPCTEAAEELWGGGCSCVHTFHYQVFIYCCEKGNFFIWSCSSIRTKFRLLLSWLKGIFLFQFLHLGGHILRDTPDFKIIPNWLFLMQAAFSKVFSFP